MSKRVLMIAFEFPPSNGASVQRIMSAYKAFVKDGWIVDVLTASPVAYVHKIINSDSELVNLNNGKIMRCLAFDALEQMSIKGKHVGSFIYPDRFGLTWCPSALLRGAAHVKLNKVDLIWSSAPIPSVHFVASKLQRISGAKWVADYRDPMAYMHDEEDRLSSVHKMIDGSVFKNASVATYATSEIKSLYEAYYQGASTEHVVVNNGYDEEKLEKAHIRKDSVSNIFKNDVFSLYYAGVLYENGRDVMPIFSALATIKEKVKVPFELVFQGAGNGEEFKSDIERMGLEGNIRFLPPVSMDDALVNMLNADALVLIQDEIFNSQVPGKIYEYIATNKRILLKTPQGSATDSAMKEQKGVFQCYEKNDIEKRLLMLFQEKDLFTRGDSVKEFSRVKQSNGLVGLSNRLIGK